MRRYAYPSSGDRFATFIDDDGNPPCNSPDDCNVCRLFSQQRPDEMRREWFARIAPTPYRRTS